jgi:hypothetical protein
MSERFAGIDTLRGIFCLAGRRKTREDFLDALPVLSIIADLDIEIFTNLIIHQQMNKLFVFIMLWMMSCLPTLAQAPMDGGVWIETTLVTVS